MYFKFYTMSINVEMTRRVAAMFTYMPCLHITVILYLQFNRILVFCVLFMFPDIRMYVHLILLLNITIVSYVDSRQCTIALQLVLQVRRM